MNSGAFQEAGTGTATVDSAARSGLASSLEFDIEKYLMQAQLSRDAQVKIPQGAKVPLAQTIQPPKSDLDQTIADAFGDMIAPSFWTSPVPPLWAEIPEEELTSAIRRIGQRVCRRFDGRPIFSRAYIDASLKGELGKEYPGGK